MARHNKKRNVGLIYEQLVYHLSKAVVEDDKKTVKVVKNIIRNRFKPGTELYKEFRLFNALVKTGNASEQLAFRIIDEAKKASLDHDRKKLDREKSLLIKEINHNLDNKNFYNKKVDNYQVYASAQQLFNAWRTNSQDISAVALHETTIQNWLTREVNPVQLDEHLTENVNDLTVKIMQEKLQSRYGTSFSDRQAKMFRLYCEGNFDELAETMQEIQLDVSQLVRKYKKVSSDKFLLERVEKTSTVITESSFSNDIDSVSKMMLLDQLSNELRGMTDV